MSKKIRRPVRFLKILAQRMREESLKLDETLPTKKQISDKMGLIFP